ncbi:MAG: transposase [Gallionellales bacterium RIFCSPLOWO2_02_FULL_57_47]|nr:MAG: transposase [Gallionellales bacterium RIFCSPLOWO2_02_FULL_57_47]OGT07931.1 MAG: transposase [Gallionellales bacterium RIFCSPHIGHO2_02_FULL_57_16]
MDDPAKQPHGKNLRKGRVSLPNHAYLVTIVTASRKPAFISFAAARAAVRCLHDKDVVRHAQTLAYVVMPDHVHWLLQLGEEGNLSETVRLYKTRVSLLLRQQIWQRGFHDHAVRSDEDLRDIARYIIANPLRSGLASSVGEYPHWDAIWL